MCRKRFVTPLFSYPACSLKFKMAIQYIPEPVQIKTNEITANCFDWCKEQYEIHQQNLEISELSFIVIALIALVVHWTLNNHWEYFKQDFKEEYLEKIYDATLDIVFGMLIMFIIYMRWFR